MPWSSLVSWIFAPQCAACGAPSPAPLCEPCRGTLLELGPACPRCAEPTGPLAVVCRRCARAPLPLAAVIAPWRFGGELATAIRRLKFAGASHVARTIAPLWSPVLAAVVAEARAPVVVPVPLHWRRRLRRGFDQSWLLAHHALAAEGLRVPLIPALRRVRATPPQSRLGAAERLANVRAAFALRPRHVAAIADRPVVLVDDVATTGATLAAAARALLAGGAREVIVVVLARAESTPGS
jgi:ComF family protein